MGSLQLGAAMLLGLSGIATSAVMKYADSIVKTYTTGASLVVTLFLSALIFKGSVGVQEWLGSMMVVGALLLKGGLEVTRTPEGDIQVVLGGLNLTNLARSLGVLGLAAAPSSSSAAEANSSTMANTTAGTSTKMEMLTMPPRANEGQSTLPR